MNFERLFSKKEVSNDVPELKLKRKTISILDLVLASDAATSKSDARRLIEQGGVDMDNVVKKDAREVITLHGGEVIKLGKKRFFRIK